MVSEKEAIEQFNQPDYIVEASYKTFYWFNLMLMWKRGSSTPGSNGTYSKIKEIDGEIWRFESSYTLTKLDPDVQVKWQLSNVDKILLGNNNS